MHVACSFKDIYRIGYYSISLSANAYNDVAIISLFQPCSDIEYHDVASNHGIIFPQDGNLHVHVFK